MDRYHIVSQFKRRERVNMHNIFFDSFPFAAPKQFKSAKAMVVIAAEEEGNGIGRIRLGRVLDASSPSLHGFIQNAITPGSTIHTDGWAPYRGLEKLGYSHAATPLKGKGKTAAVKLLPRVHRVAALLRAIP